MTSPGTRAMTDQLMAECRDCLKVHRDSTSALLAQGKSRAEVFEAIVGTVMGSASRSQLATMYVALLLEATIGAADSEEPAGRSDPLLSPKESRAVNRLAEQVCADIECGDQKCEDIRRTVDAMKRLIARLALARRAVNGEEP